MKALVAYFSPSGTTEGQAKELGDLFEIRPVQAYTAADLDWSNPNSRSTIEMKGGSSVLSELAETANLNGYDTLFLNIQSGLRTTI